MRIFPATNLKISNFALQKGGVARVHSGCTVLRFSIDLTQDSVHGCFSQSMRAALGHTEKRMLSERLSMCSGYSNKPQYNSGCIITQFMKITINI